MNKKNRPKCVTVIGRVWIVLSILICISALLNLVATSAKTPPIAVLQIILSVAAFTSAVMFLKLHEKARRVLEYITWISLAFIVGFPIVWAIKWVSVSTEKGSTEFTIIGAIMGVVTMAFYGIPMGILLKFVRSQAVRNAMLKDSETHE